MRKICLILFINLLGTVPLHTQGTFWRTLFTRSKQAANPRLKHINVSRQLNQRVARTYQQALQEIQLAPSAYKTMSFGDPINAVFHPAELSPSLYPDQDFLVTPKQTGQYLAARNNVLVRNELRRTARLQDELDSVLPALETAAQLLEQPSGPEEFAPWIAQQISPQIHYLFIGEAHNYIDIRELVADILTQLRAKYPTRPLLLFTEFLPEEVSWSLGENPPQLSKPMPLYFPIWDESVKQHIPVIGLEPNFAIGDKCQVRHGNLPLYYQREDVWKTLEGVRLRNKHWQTILNKYRTNFPDALFIIYTGADHCIYNRPFALSNNYEGQETFVVTLHPASRTSYRKSGFLKIAKETQVPAPGPLERLTHTDKFPQPALKWDDPQLIRISGFNVRLKVPIPKELMYQ